VAAVQSFIDAIRAALAAHGDPVRAPQMQAYMKSALPFHGVPTPLRRQLAKEVAADCPIRSTTALADTMRALWRAARFREERYVAAELGRTGPYRRHFGLALLPVYEQMIREGAWWDVCDEISGTAIASLLADHPAHMKRVLRKWAHGDDLWLRRAAILCQRNAGPEIDARLLYEFILASLDHPDFFMRKGIGWALRQRAYVAPDEVRAFCAHYAARISPLTRREALRVIDGA
jgi:3-methyladenine DNA glycosylase AlkD